MHHETNFKTLNFSGTQSKLNTNGFIPAKLRESKGALADEKKTFFVFGKTSKQSDFNNPMKVSRIYPNKKSIDIFLEENPFSNTKDTKFKNSNLDFNKIVDRVRPHSSHIKKKIWIEKKDRKKFEKSAVSKPITVNEKNNRYTINEQMILFDIEKEERKHFINDVLKIDFPDEDKIEYSEKPSENRKRKKELKEKEIKASRPKTALPLKNGLFKEENLKADQLGIDDEKLIEELVPKSKAKKIPVSDFKPTYNAEDFISTIEKIKDNPDSFKFTNKVNNYLL
jgi:hypothetical protein